MMDCQHGDTRLGATALCFRFVLGTEAAKIAWSRLRVKRGRNRAPPHFSIATVQALEIIWSGKREPNSPRKLGEGVFVCRFFLSRQFAVGQSRLLGAQIRLGLASQPTSAAEADSLRRRWHASYFFAKAGQPPGASMGRNALSPGM